MKLALGSAVRVRYSNDVSRDPAGGECEEMTAHLGGVTDGETCATYAEVFGEPSA